MVMKKYKSSDLTHKRAEVLKDAKSNGVIIQQLETNGDVRQEFLLIGYDNSRVIIDDVLVLSENGGL